MAAGTGRIGGPEGSANMAALTGDIRMCAIEHEPRTEVIEGLLRAGLAKGKQAESEDRNKKQADHCNDLTSLKVSAE
jgi:hypothetical protein